MVKDDDEDDISEEEIQARIEALMEENSAEKETMESVSSGKCHIIKEHCRYYSFSLYLYISQSRL